MNTVLPEWAPNIHPLLVHFPIALFLVAMLADGALLMFQKEWLRNTAVSLFVLSALAAGITYLSGKQAVDSLMIPFEAELTASSHADWAFYTLLYFTLFAAVRGFLFGKKRDTRKIVLVGALLLSLVGAVLLAYTADKGGKLVYKYGVGTRLSK